MNDTAAANMHYSLVVVDVGEGTVIDTVFELLLEAMRSCLRHCAADSERCHYKAYSATVAVDLSCYSKTADRIMLRSSSSCWNCSADRESTTHCPLGTCSANEPAQLNASCPPCIFAAVTGGNNFDDPALRHECSLTCHGWVADRY